MGPVGTLDIHPSEVEQEAERMVAAMLAGSGPSASAAALDAPDR